MIRTKIWYNLVNLKFKCYYISHMIDKIQKRNLYINIFLALASLSSIAAWAIWKVFPEIWGVIIAASNILIAIKPLLGDDKKIKQLNEILPSLESIEIEYEKLFFNLDDKKIDEKECAEIFFVVYEKQIKALKTSADVILGLDKRIKELADSDTNRYIFNNYQTKSK